ncbi:MAG: hypothetical protein AAGL98_12180, partial [Planctomycetota bacterium]
LAPDRAPAASHLITVAMGQSSGEEQTWFDRSLALDPLAWRTYFRMLQAARPRWGGSNEQLLEVCRRAIEVGRYDSLAPEIVPRTVNHILADGDTGTLKAHADVLWPLLDQYIKGRSEHPTRGRSADWCASRGVIVAYLTGDFEKLNDYFERLGADPSRLIDLHEYQLDARWVIGRAYASANPEVWERCQIAQRLADAGQSDEAMAALRSAVPFAREVFTREHLRDLMALQKWKTGFERGDWVDLFTDGLAGWRPTRGRFEVQDSGAIHGFYDINYGGLRMLCGYDPGPCYEAEMVFEIPRSVMEPRTFGGVGFILAPKVDLETYKNRFIFVSRSGRSSIWLKDPRNTEDKSHFFGRHDKPKALRYVVRLERWGRDVRIHVNGASAEPTYRFYEGWPEQDGLAVSTWLH